MFTGLLQAILLQKMTISLKNKAFVGLGSCDNVQTERKIFEYANWPWLQIKRTGLSIWSIQLVRLAGPSSWSVQLVRPAGPSSWSVQLVRPAGLSSCPSVPVHVLQSAHVVKCKKQFISYTFN